MRKFMQHRRRIATTITFSFTMLNCRPAVAENPQTKEEQADALMNEVNVLMDAGNYADACPKLEKLILTIPNAIGAHKALGECYENQRRFYSACIAYLKAARFAKSTNDERARDSTAACDEYDDIIPRVVIKAPKDAPNLNHWRIILDGAPYLHFNSERFAQTGDAVLYVDQGLHKLGIVYNGHQAWNHQVVVQNGEVLKIDVPILPIFNQMPGRTNVGFAMVAISSGFTAIGGTVVTFLGGSSNDSGFKPVFTGVGVGLVATGIIGIIGAALMLPPKENSENKKSAHSPLPQWHLNLAPNGASFKLTF